MLIDLPNISGTPEEQLSQIKSYLYKLNEQLTVLLNQLTTEKFWQETESAINAVNNGSGENKDIMISSTAHSAISKIINKGE